MQKKTMLIVNNNMEIGGIQKALANMLSEIHEQYDITLLLFHMHGELLKDIPGSVKVKEVNSNLSMLGVSFSQSREMGLFYFLMRSALVLFSKIFGNKLPIRFLIHTAKDMGFFDIAISYMQNSAFKIFYGGCNEFVLEKVKSDRKISFAHCDFEKYEGNHAYNRSLYKEFDKIVTVSKSCSESIMSVLPDLKDKICCVHNFCDFKQIESLSNQNPYFYDQQYTNIVTLARLAEEKGIIRSLTIIKKLHDEGFSIRWYLIGDGPLYRQINDFVKNEKLEEVIFLMGKQENPYKFLKNADLLFVPSYHEAAPMVFREASCLKVPILSTNTCSAMELVEKEKIGWVCENDEDSIFYHLKELLKDSEKIKDMKDKMVMINNNDEALLELRLSISEKM